MSNTITLDRAAFAAWLATLPQTEPFARAGSACQCPIAQFLCWLGYNFVSVTPEYIHTTLGDYIPPTWATLFIDALDGVIEPLECSVTPEQALSVLATISEEIMA